MNPGTVVYCKLTGKRMIIQRVLYNEKQEAVFAGTKYICRYWSKMHDRFYSTFAYPEEVTTKKSELPFFNNNNDKH